LNTDRVDPDPVGDLFEDREAPAVQINGFDPLKALRQGDRPLPDAAPHIKNLASGKHDPVQPVEIIGQPESVFGLNELSFIVGLLQSDYLLKRRKFHLAIIMLRN
jgi:hypothetical protein